VRIKVLETPITENSPNDSESLNNKPEVFAIQEKKAGNTTEFSNSNNSYCAQNESDFIAEKKEINEFRPKKTHSVEQLLSETAKFTDGSKSKNEMNNNSKTVNFKEMTMETMSLQNTKSVENMKNNAVKKKPRVFYSNLIKEKRKDLKIIIMEPR